MPLCLLCPVGHQPTFAGVGELATHISQTHSKPSVNGVAQSRSTRCCVCNKSFTTPVGLLSHQKAKHHFLPCSPCSREFADVDELVQHQCEAHGSRASSTSTVVNSDVTPDEPALAEKRTLHRCKECEAHFDSPVELESHESSHRKFPCSKCSQFFSSLVEWNDHFKKEHQKPIQCSGCKADFASEALLASHGSSCAAVARPASAQFQPNKPTSPPSQRRNPYVCEFCNKKFKVQEGLQAHMAAKHPAGVKCIICHLVLPASAALEEHVDTVHTCTVCHDGILRDAQTLADHMLEHTHPIPCKKCGTRYRTEEERMLHFTTADDCHPACRDCQIGFEDEEASRTHMRLVHPASPKSSPRPSTHRSSPPIDMEAHVRCDVCHEACSSQTELEVHVVTVHSCPICHDGIYMDTRALEQHLEQHRAPYGCSTCSLAYTEEEHLLQHYRESPSDIHPHCEKCGIGFENHDWYTSHIEEAHPRIACDACDGALFDQDELAGHYLSSPNHPKCDKCGIGFRDQFDFTDHGASAHPECHCYMCQWHFDTPQILQNHIRHFSNHPKCPDCNIRFPDADAYQHHLFVTHRPSFSQYTGVSSDEDCGGRMNSADHPSPLLSARGVDPLWGFEASTSLPYASFIPLPPSLSGYSSPSSQRVTVESPVQDGSLGSHSRSSTLSVEQRSPTDGRSWEATARSLSLDVEQSLKPAFEFDHSPLSTVPVVGTPPPGSTGDLIQSIEFPFSPRPDPQPLFSLSQGIVDAVVMHDDAHSDSSSSFTRSPPLISPVVKLPDPAAASPSSTTSGWTMTSDTASKRSLRRSVSSSEAGRGLYPATRTASSTHSGVPQLSLLVPSLLNSASNSGYPSSISPESAGISVSATMTPEYIREARAYLSLTQQIDDPASPTISRSPGVSSSPILSSTGIALGERGHRREVRFEDNIMTESAWDRQSTSSDSSLDPPVVLPRPGLGNFRVNGISKLPRFSALKRPTRKWTNGHANHILPHPHGRRSNGASQPAYHCRSCYRDHCEEPTTTTCGHLFCYDCISTAVMKDSRCPVCQAPTLLYCLFRIDTSV